MVKDVKIPLGATCHYEKLKDGWYVVWGPDFFKDVPGKAKCSNRDSMMLEMGWQVGRNEALEQLKGHDLRTLDHSE